MSEESFLRYRLEIVKKMADGPLKTAILAAIAARAEALRGVGIIVGTSLISRGK